MLSLLYDLFSLSHNLHTLDASWFKINFDLFVRYFVLFSLVFDLLTELRFASTMLRFSFVGLLLDVHTRGRGLLGLANLSRKDGHGMALPCQLPMMSIYASKIVVVYIVEC